LLTSGYRYHPNKVPVQDASSRPLASLHFWGSQKVDEEWVKWEGSGALGLGSAHGVHRKTPAPTMYR